MACAVAMPVESVRVALAEIQNPFSPLFKEENGRLVSNGLRKSKEHQERKSEAGGAGARARWKNATASDSQCQENATASEKNANASKTDATASNPQCPLTLSLTLSPSLNNNNTPLPPKGGDVEMPELLSKSQEFCDRWNNWLEHLKQKKKKPTTLARKQQLNRCAEWGVQRAIRAIDFSIAQNWQSIYESREQVKEFKTPDSNQMTETIELRRL